MKRFLLPCLFLFLFCSASAQEYTVSPDGQKQFASLYNWGVYSGGEFSLGIGSIQTGSENRAGQDYTSPGFTGNASLMVDMTPYVASGVDYLYGGFRTPDHTAGNDYTLSSHHISAAFKIRANPNSKVRLYFPVGAGGGGLFLKTQSGGTENRNEQWGLSVYAGAGVEADISPTAFLGLEYRYIYSFIQASDLDPQLGPNRYFAFHALMLKIGMRLF